ncbi:MAG: hypothetical protein IPK93_12330 [Solirubrobacterales bacterium]|nr:hypothetical protein [Solirubrobacterales bacterium]
MSERTFESNRKSRLFFAAILGAALLVAAFTFGSANNANADSSVSAKKARKSKVLGAIGAMPEPLCPLNCSGLAIVSGYQAKIDGVKNPYRIPFNGYVTKWKISLGSVNKSQRDFFEEKFGPKPKAGISILKPVKVRGKRQFKLVKRSPVEGLNKYLGDVATIRLDRRIKVKKNWVVALTVPTWGPALARVMTGAKPSKPDTSYNWRAGRERDTCAQEPNLKNSVPQTKPKSKRAYGCRFSAEQLTYRVKVTNK